MFTAKNLNDLYARFDRKCYLALNGMSPLFANSAAGVWQGQYPYGVWYVYRNNPDTCKRLRDIIAVGGDYIPGIGTAWRDEHSQQAAKDALSRLETKWQDTAGGQVYVDHWVASGDTFTCDIASIHYSFELLTREVGGIKYDIHLGWDPPSGSGLTSYVRGSLGAGIDPTLPPGRIHKHRMAVAEIATEEISEFKILNTYQRYDCWRVHACGKSGCTVFLQLPDGSSERHLVGRGECRAFRRKPDGTWASSFPGGGVCRYFFPYFSGDIPFLAEGPPEWSNISDLSEFLTLERSARANNVANPFIMFEWRRVMGAVHDPFLPYDPRQVYTGVYADPSNANTTIGDAVFTWGRARVIYVNPDGNVSREIIKIFSGANNLVGNLRSLGITVNETDTQIELSSTIGEIRIYPIDANIFTTINAPLWVIYAYPSTISTIYPAQYSMGMDPFLGPGTYTWDAGNEPTIFDSMRDLRRKIGVEIGFINTYTEVDDITEEKVSIISMTPMGLMCRAATSYGIGGSTLNNVETIATNETLYVADRPAQFGVGAWQNWLYTSGTHIFYLQVPGAINSLQWSNILPARNPVPASSMDVPAVNTAYIPPGGPWGFSSSVYDFEQVRAYDIDMAAGGVVDNRPWGADFWINKWGGPNGSDASVRLPGSPNKTQKYAYVPTAPNSSFVDLVEAGKDDIFKDGRGASFASTVPFYSWTYFAPYRDNMTHICWTGGDDQARFEIPYTPIGNPYRPGSGPFFHKIPKSAWLWDLMEWSVRSWTRAVPLCHGQGSCPLFDATGSFRVLGVLTINMVLLGTSGVEFGGPSFYLTEQAYDLLIANGITCYRDQDSGGNDYWFVNAANLASYSVTQGFIAYNFDAENGQPNASPPIAATGFVSKRNYSFGETNQGSGYYDPSTSTQYFDRIRYVNVRLGNELSGNNPIENQFQS
jgi:hypothetical protein